MYIVWDILHGCKDNIIHWCQYQATYEYNRIDALWPGVRLLTWINLPTWICNYTHCKKKLFVHSQTSTVQLSAKFWPFCFGLTLLNIQQYSYSQPNMLTSHNQREHNMISAARIERNRELRDVFHIKVCYFDLWSVKLLTTQGMPT